jgi:hypothetical protein
MTAHEAIELWIAFAVVFVIAFTGGYACAWSNEQDTKGKST